MNDKIFVHGLRIFGYHGVHPVERDRGQEFVVDLEVELDLAEAGRTDDVSFTLDYGALIRRIQDVVGREHFELLEALAARLASIVLEDERVLGTLVRVAKPRPPTLNARIDGVGVEIRRER
ncbi:MAG: dihydroneopterin aldolase [Actinomycetota bacterium]